MQLELNLYPKDDNLIRLMLQPPKTGKDDPYFIAAERANRKRRRGKYGA